MMWNEASRLCYASPANGDKHMSIIANGLVRRLSFLAPALLFSTASVETARADSVKILAWNITGAAVAEDATNLEIAATIFSREDADVVLLSETRRAATEIAGVLDATYTLAASSSDGQDIWVRDTGRFSVDQESTGSWSVRGRRGTQDGVWAELVDDRSDQRLFLYNVHLPIPDNFRNREADLEVNNRGQQQGICDIIVQMEGDAGNGIVIIGGDFNDVGLADEESVIDYLRGTGTLAAVPGCGSTDIAMTDAVRVDVTHILGTGDAELYTDASSMSAGDVGFGQHGYVTINVALADTAQSSSDADTPLGVARFTSSDALIFPDDTDRWVYVGTNIGGDYSDAEFDPRNPGMIGVVQMEPNAYRYLLEHNEYADGTMYLLSFFRAQEKPDPELSGFVQGDLAAREIHVIDSTRYQDGRGFYLFSAAGSEPSSMLPPGNECVQCHAEHGAYDSTFTQFYPVIRPIVSRGASSGN